MDKTNLVLLKIYNFVGEKLLWSKFLKLLFFAKKKKTTVHILHPREGQRRSGTLCPLQDQKALTSLQQWKLIIAVAHSPFFYLIGTLIILK